MKHLFRFSVAAVTVMFLMLFNQLAMEHMLNYGLLARLLVWIVTCIHAIIAVLEGAKYFGNLTAAE
jgi:hypothetical protein